MGVPLNKIPQGLLDFFGIKSGEWGPRELGQTLSPVIELGRWYLDGYATEFSVSVTGGPIFVASLAAGTMTITSTTPVVDGLDLTTSPGNIFVPQNEVWLILEASVAWFYTANPGLSGEFMWASRGNFLPSHTHGATVSDAAIGKQGSRSLARPFWSRPGDTLSLSNTGLVVPAGSVQLSQPRLRIARFRI